MKIVVGVPVVQEGMAHILINQILNNSLLPDKLILIDNTEKGNFFPNTMPISSIVIRQGRMGVNKSWNRLFKEAFYYEADVLSVLNDDIEINKYFFEKIIRTFEKIGKAAVVCPNTLREKCRPVLNKSRKDWNRLFVMPRREGWAYTIRTSVLKHIPKIPLELKTFCGDDWLWYHTLALGYMWVKMLDNYIFHYGSTTIKKDGKRIHYRPDLRVFRELLSKSLRDKNARFISSLNRENFKKFISGTSQEES